MFLPREFHGQRNLEGYSPWGHKESDTTERLTLSQRKEVLSFDEKKDYSKRLLKMRAVFHEGGKKKCSRSSGGMKLWKGAEMQLDFRDNTTVTESCRRGEVEVRKTGPQTHNVLFMSFYYVIGGIKKFSYTREQRSSVHLW